MYTTLLKHRNTRPSFFKYLYMTQKEVCDNQKKGTFFLLVFAAPIRICTAWMWSGLVDYGRLITITALTALVYLTSILANGPSTQDNRQFKSAEIRRQKIFIYKKKNLYCILWTHKHACLSPGSYPAYLSDSDATNLLAKETQKALRSLLPIKDSGLTNSRIAGARFLRLISHSTF